MGVGFHDLIHRGIRCGIAYVFRDGTVEQEGVLKNRRDHPSETFDRDIVDIMAVYQDLSG